MKTITTTILLMSLVISSISQTVIISGMVKNFDSNKEVSLTYYNNNLEFIKETADKTQLDENGKFTLTFLWSKPMQVDFFIGKEHTNLFLIPGDSINLTVDYSNFDETIKYFGKGEADNNYMAAELLQEFDKKANVYSKYTDGDKFKTFVDSIKKAHQKFFDAHSSSELSSDLKHYITTNIKYRYINPQWMFKVKYDTATKKFSTKDLPESYFSFLKDIDLNDQNASDNDNYYTALDRYISEFNDLKNDKTIADSLSEAKKVEMKTVKLYYYRKKIFKGKILDYELTSFLKRVIMQNKIDKNIMDDLIRDYKTTCTNKEYISIINNTYNQVQKLGKGKPAPEFSLKDKDGKVISLTDLKGKIVYIDFWATWCGPCRAEMPDAKKLEEEFKDKDVVFLNINVEDNIELWNKYLVKNNDGINVFADGEQTKKLKEDYAFDGIPRYVLIDRNGKLLNANAARPSGNINKSITDALK